MEKLNKHHLQKESSTGNAIVYVSICVLGRAVCVSCRLSPSQQRRQITEIIMQQSGFPTENVVFLTPQPLLHKQNMDLHEGVKLRIFGKTSLTATDDSLRYSE